MEIVDVQVCPLQEEAGTVVVNDVSGDEGKIVDTRQTLVQAAR